MNSGDYHFVDTNPEEFGRTEYNMGLLDPEFPVDAQIGPGRIDVPDDNLETFLEHYDF